MVLTTLSVITTGPCLKAQFQTYAVFIYLLHGNAMLLS